MNHTSQRFLLHVELHMYEKSTMTEIFVKGFREEVNTTDDIHRKKFYGSDNTCLHIT